MDAELRRLTQEQPDSVVGVLVQLRSPGNGARRAELESAGLSVGTIVGEIASGRLRACDAPRVARLDSVRYLELAREVPRPPPIPA
jgi:hypothetical protein